MASDTAGLPRLLFLTREIPQAANAGSQQLLRALRGYPVDRLLVIGPAAAPGAELLPCEYLAYPLPVTRWINSRFHRSTNLANALGLVPRHRRIWLRAQVARFRPDVVATVMDCFSYYSVAADVARESRVPLLTITMDRPDIFEEVSRPFRRVQFRRIGRIYRQASVNVVVSRQMSRWLKLVFRCPSLVHYFAPSADIPTAAPDRCLKPRTPGRFTLAYAGSLEYGYERQIAALLPEAAVAGVTLRVYSAHRNRLPVSPALDVRPFLPAPQLWRELVDSCDALLLPYPFGHERATLYRTHFPTKLSEYYTLGLPVFMLGPADATGIRWGLDHPGSALVVTDRDPVELRAALAALKEDGDYRVRLATAAVRIAHEQFDPLKSRADFASIICRAASGRPSP